MLEVFELEEFRRRFLGVNRFPELDPGVAVAAAEVLEEVRSVGDEAVARYTALFDGAEVSAADLRVPREAIEAAVRAADPRLVDSLQMAADRIRDFHRGQIERGYSIVTSGGSVAGQLVRPLARVGVYAPGGRAAYPSSLLMGAIPAQLAGVEEIAVCSPPGPSGDVASVVLVAASILGLDEIYRIGGVQAIGAMAYGTQSVDRVDKIVGPGNSYVTAAKKQVFGIVGIDGLAGPSELAVVCDSTADAQMVALDLLAQAEHDPEARVYLLSTDEGLVRDILARMGKIGPGLYRWNIIRESLTNWGGALVADESDLWEVCNGLAPEHLSIQTSDPWAGLGRVRNAGAVFLGNASAVSFGDYTAGPNHVLPTAGTARYASPLGVSDFVKRSSYLNMSARDAAEMAPGTARIAGIEGLTGHGLAAEARGSESP